MPPTGGNGPIFITLTYFNHLIWLEQRPKVSTIPYLTIVETHSGGCIVQEGIRGNAPQKIKLLASKMLLYLVDGYGTSKGSVYSSDTGRKLQFKEIQISGGNSSNLPETAVTELVESYKGRDDLMVETVFEIIVDEGVYSDSLPSSCLSHPSRSSFPFLPFLMWTHLLERYV